MTENDIVNLLREALLTFEHVEASGESLQTDGYLTRDKGFALVTDDGRTFLVTVREG